MSKPDYVPTELKGLEARKARSQSLMKKYPDRVPIIVKKSSDTEGPQEAVKFIVPYNLTVSKIIQVLREKVHLAPYEAIYISADNQFILSGSQTIGTVYDNHKSEDGFLHLVYCKESVFGGGTQVPLNPLNPL